MVANGTLEVAIFSVSSPCGEDSAALTGVGWSNLTKRYATTSFAPLLQSELGNTPTCSRIPEATSHLTRKKYLLYLLITLDFSPTPHFKYTLATLGGRIEPQLSRLSAYCAELSRWYQSLHARFPARAPPMGRS